MFTASSLDFSCDWWSVHYLLSESIHLQWDLMWFLNEEDIPIVKQAYFYHTVFFEKIPETQFHDVVRCTSLAVSICLYYHSSQISVRVYVVCSYLKLKDLSEVVHGMWCLVKRTRVSEVHDLFEFCDLDLQDRVSSSSSSCAFIRASSISYSAFCSSACCLSSSRSRSICCCCSCFNFSSFVCSAFAFMRRELVVDRRDWDECAVWEVWPDSDELADSPSRTSSLSAFLASIMWYRSFIWASTLRYNSRAFSASSQS